MLNSSSIPSQIIIATRESALALWQANFIQSTAGEIIPANGMRDIGDDHERGSDT